MKKMYSCKNCSWTGNQDEIEFDTVDTCFGDDKIEMCPSCGSYEIREISANANQAEQ